MENQQKAYSYIRFSTPEQLKGDSLRRQTEASENYCVEHGLVLDDSLNLRDLGLSAYHGKHKSKGALGMFLLLVEQGKIEPGSVLIVENLDRLSREQVLDALNQFTGIIQAGIRLVTLQDGMRYDKQSITDNWTQLIISITYMARAHEESLTKSKRLKATWEQKRVDVTNGEKILTSRCPLWIRAVKQPGKKTTFALIPERCKAIETIYRMRLDGKGKSTIVKELNNDQDVWKPEISKRNRTGGWQEPYVVKILSDPIVIGTLQPRKRQGKSKKAVAGEPIKNYYPAAISEDLFYEVQALRKAERPGGNTGGGQTGKASNLFIHLAKCGLCGTPMHFINNGVGSYRYLRCDISRRGLDCKAKSTRYDEIENLIFSNLEELNIADLLPNTDETIIRLNDIDRQLTAARQKLVELDQGIENISDVIFNTKDKNVRITLEKRLKKAIDEQSKLNKSIISLTEEQKTASVKAEQFKANVDQAKEVYQLLQDTETEQEQISLRLKLRVELQRIIKQIDIYPLMEQYKAEEEVEPGVYQTMNSRSINKIRITFNGSRNKRLILLKTFAVKDLNNI